MGTEYRELGALGRDLAIWEIHLRSTGKSTHTVRSYVQGVRALAGFLTDQGLPLDPERITTSQLRALQAHLLLPKDQGGAGKRTSTVCTRHDALKLFFAFLEEEDDLPNPMRRVQRPTEEEVTIQPLTEDQLAALIDTCQGKDFYDRRDMALIRMWVSTPSRHRPTRRRRRTRPTANRRPGPRRPPPHADQQTMIRNLASSGAGVDVVVGKAGTGKSTALGAYRAALDAAGIAVIGVAPSATAAHQLAISAGIYDTATVDRLLVELDHRRRRGGRGAPRPGRGVRPPRDAGQGVDGDDRRLADPPRRRRRRADAGRPNAPPSPR